ncbi:MAG: LysR family transcriptional regulator [Roseibium sp.]
MLDDVSLFVHIVQSRSLAAAANRLNLPAATVTRRLKKLEQRLEVQLVHRSARKFALTTEGEVYYETFADLVDQFEASMLGLSEDRKQLSGKLKVAAPTNISVGILQPMWSSFIQEFPQIQLDLRLNNDNKDLIETQTDLALRIGPQTDTRLFQKRLGRVATILVASSQYIENNGSPERVEDLLAHRLIGVSMLQNWQLTQRATGRQEMLRLVAKVSVDDIGLATQLSADGHGIVLMPVSEIVDELEAGKLIQLLPDWRGADRDVYTVWPSGRLLSRRAKCLASFMENYLAKRPVFQGVLPI